MCISWGVGPKNLSFFPHTKPNMEAERSPGSFLSSRGLSSFWPDSKVFHSAKLVSALAVFGVVLIRASRILQQRRRERQVKEFLVSTPNHGFSVGIIGGGFSGIIVARKCQQLGIPYHIYEKERDYGGTWMNNDYPGCACDVRIHAYCFSFAMRRKCEFLW